MTDLPIRRLTVSDFRRLNGMRVLPFDAPVVLIHGPNGTGKTSVLSALELALTGAVRSMALQSDKYFAHLPTRGQRHATVLADVADYLQAGPPGVPLTVDWSEIDGTPAFNKTAAQFYAERCYLDQASLGRLLEVYQARVGSEETALEKFVNELLGLEKLDALRTGLSKANDLRLLKKLAVGVAEADSEAKAASAQLEEQGGALAGARVELAMARAATREAIEALHEGRTDGMTDGDLLGFVRFTLNNDTTQRDTAAATKLHQELISLGGRISAIAERPSSQRIRDALAALDAADAELKSWESIDGVRVLEWETAADACGADTSDEPIAAIAYAQRIVEHNLQTAADLDSKSQALLARIEDDRQMLDGLQERLAAANELSSALVEGLAALRTVIDDAEMFCPVCDLNFADARQPHTLATHVDRKLTELSTHSRELVLLRNVRDRVATQIAQGESEYAQLAAVLTPASERQELEQRRAQLAELAEQAPGIEAAKSRGANLASRKRNLRTEVENLQAAASEAVHVGRELIRFARLLHVELVPTVDSYRAAWTELLAQAEAEVVRHKQTAERYRHAASQAARLTEALDREARTVERIADLAERKQFWDERVTEAKRRQTVAREVRDAATKARTRIVHRVFTHKLNEVWKSVFTRLAPNEDFIPSFGMPNATKKAFEIKVETTHRDGQSAGPPQMMLSAGNLNTAALSLFLALHLAVTPIVPCLVLDDPVQAMDEVHIAQFAALIRLLAKQNNRQVVIAVHERELFDYLTLELSPAYEGDELITIELGERAMDEDEGITRYTWAPDPAIAN